MLFRVPNKAFRPPSSVRSLSDMQALAVWCAVAFLVPVLALFLRSLSL